MHYLLLTLFALAAGYVLTNYGPKITSSINGSLPTSLTGNVWVGYIVTGAIVLLLVWALRYAFRAAKVNV